jgi:Ca-activated chloride channel family protein
MKHRPYLFVLALVSILFFTNAYTPILPTGGAPAPTLSPIDSQSNGLMHMKTALDNDYYMVSNNEGMGYLYVKLHADEYVPLPEEVRTPLNISIVIDRSGSMQGDRLLYAKKAAQFVVDQLDEHDYISIVTYEDGVQVVSSSAKVKNKTALKNAIEKISTDGSTNLSGGLEEGYKQVKSTYQKGFVNRVLLLSDGRANKGITNMTELNKIAEIQNQQEGITLSTFGVGLGYNENLMQGLADNGSGNYYFIETPEDVAKIFNKELNGLLSTVAQNLVLKVKLPQGTTFSKLFGYKYEEKNNEVTVNFRDVSSKEIKAVLIRYNITAGTNSELKFHSEATYQDPLNGDVAKSLSTIEIQKPIEDADVIKENINEWVMQQVVLFESNDILAAAMKEVDNRNFEEARKLVSSNSKYMKEQFQYVSVNREMFAQDSTNTAYMDKIKKAETMSTREMNMMQKSSKSMNYKLNRAKY